MSHAGYFTIGKVVEKLKTKHPDLSVSKIRYLEEEGLLVPSSRTKGGYRLFSNSDIKRLDTILCLQKEKFLPLSVIKEYLEDPKSQAFTLASTPFQTYDKETYSLEETQTILDITSGFIRQLSEVGIIKLKKESGSQFLVMSKDFNLISTCFKLRMYGIEPKHLRQYVTAANRESFLFEQALIPFSKKNTIDASGSNSTLEDAFQNLCDLINILRQQLIKDIVFKSIDPSKK